RVLVTANSQDQLRDTIWPEIRRWAEQLPKPLYERLEFQADHIFLKGVGGSFVTARTASRDNPTALQGLHDENMLLVLDEAPGIPDIVFELGLGTMSTPGAKMLMAGNPSETGGFFYDTHHGLRSRWYTMRVSCEDVSRAKGHIDDVVAKYGRDSNAYRVRVLGEFPDTQDDAVIPLALCEAATRRNVEATDFYPVWGVDVARFGSDRTALAKRRGNTLIEPIKSWRGKDTMQVAGLILDEYRRTKDDEGKTTDDTPSEILVDVIGLGAGVVDRCAELGLPVRGINVGEAASVAERFMRLRDELWFDCRDWLAQQTSKLPKDDALIAELTACKYKITSMGKVQIESKDELKKRGLPSPDLADAFILTFAGGLDPIEREESIRYRNRWKPQKPKGSWMSV